MRFFKLCLQVGGLIALSSLGNFLSQVLHLPIPGSIIGLFLLFILLQLGIIKVHFVEIGGSWMISELLLFFVPAAVGIMSYSTLMRDIGIQLIIVIGVSTVVVMLITGLLAEGLMRWRQERENQDARVE